jgi:Pin2-interacting protein X1
LSHDPNNTKWTRDTTGFGHKIMAAQGWQPGDLLGAKDAPHAEFHTEANASHIRVVIKDDNLGLGAKRGSGLAQGECTGLDVFQKLLGRLNAEDEDEYEREQKSREDLKRAIYTEKRWGSIRFVKGGFLVGDKIQDLIDQEEDRVRQLAGDAKGARKSDSSEEAKEASKSKKDKKNKKEKSEKKDKERKQQEEVEEATETSTKSEKKSKKKRKAAAEAPEDARKSTSEAEDEKRKRKKKKQKATAENESDDDSVSTKQTPFTSTPASGTSTPLSMLGGRHAVRSRNIAQKRLAVLDTASLNQVSGPPTNICITLSRLLTMVDFHDQTKVAAIE